MINISNEQCYNHIYHKLTFQNLHPHLCKHNKHLKTRCILYCLHSNWLFSILICLLFLVFWIIYTSFLLRIYIMDMMLLLESITKDIHSKINGNSCQLVPVLQLFIDILYIQLIFTLQKNLYSVRDLRMNQTNNPGC